MAQKIKVQDGIIVYETYDPTLYDVKLDIEGQLVVTKNITVGNNTDPHGTITTNTVNQNLIITTASGGNLFLTPQGNLNLTPTGAISLNTVIWPTGPQSVTSGSFLGASNTNTLKFYPFVFAQNGSDDLTVSDLNTAYPTIQPGQCIVGPTVVYECISTNTWRILQARLGYTPVNVAGDTMLGDLILYSGAPATDQSAATKRYVDQLASGVNLHGACETATTPASNLPLNSYTNGVSGGGFDPGGQGVGATIIAQNNGNLNTLGVGGYSILSAGARILVKDQADPVQNGIYVVTDLGSEDPGGVKWILTRADDYNNSEPNQVHAGAVAYVQEGTLGGTQWIQTSQGTGPLDGTVIGFDSIVFTQFSGAGTFTGGAGIDISGNVVSNTGVLSDIAGPGISILYTGIASGTGNVTIANTGVISAVAGTGISVSSGVGNVTINTSNVPNSALTNSSITVTGGTGLGVAGSPVSLGGTVTLSNTGVLSFTGNNITRTGAVTLTSSDVTYALGYTPMSAVVIPISEVVYGTGSSVTSNSSFTFSAVTGLSVTSNTTLSGSNVSLGTIANLKITGGAGGQVLTTDGSGNLSWSPGVPAIGGAYIWTQASPSTTWVIPHMLGWQYVNVEVIDSSGYSYAGRYDYPSIYFTDANNLTLTFGSAVSGHAAVTSGGGSTGPVGPASPPGGSFGQLQFNNTATFGGATYLSYNPGTGQLTANAGITSTNTTSGTIVVTGGVGISGDVNVGGTITATTFNGSISGSGASITSGTIPNTALVNSSVTVSPGTGMSGGGNVALGGTITLTNAGVTSLTTSSGLSTNTSATGAVAITNTGVTSLTTNTGLSLNTTATGAVTVTNTGVTSLTTNSGLSTNTGATGGVSITNTGVTSNIAGTGISVSSGTGAVTITNAGVTSFTATGLLPVRTGAVTLVSADIIAALGYTPGAGGGSVTSVGMSVPSFLSVTPSTITTTGTFAVTLSGTALPIANGGTGQTTANAALNALTPSQSGNDGKFLVTDGSNISWSSTLKTSNGSVAAGTGSLATTAANGFFYIPTCSGVPTGIPTAISGYAPMVIDSTNNRLYVYVGGNWLAINVAVYS